jgi:TatD DNase family protein
VKYFDAHNHLHDARLAPHRADILASLAQLPLSGAMVNGTRENDWDAVTAICREHAWARASYGLHPWYVGQRSEAWLATLRARLEQNSAAGVGEIGLDRWIEGYDLPDQTRVFVAQLYLATELNRATTIHCVRAWGALWDVIRDTPVPPRGFLLHAYSGPMEMIEGFVSRGAYFSFSPYFLHPRKQAQRGAFQVIPVERLLVETDAPDLRPPDDANPRPLQAPDGTPLNHPANLDVAYAALAKLRSMSLQDLADRVAENFARFYSSEASVRVY